MVNQIIETNVWIMKKEYKTREMVNKMREEDIEYEKPINEEYRFIWRGSKIMVKKTWNVNIDKLTKSQREFIEEFRIITKTEQKSLFTIF